VCTLLDSALGCAVQSILPAGVDYTSIEIKVKTWPRCGRISDS
jgi:acyl-coenzyme A thioesterase PaaI-like protein